MFVFSSPSLFFTALPCRPYKLHLSHLIWSKQNIANKTNKAPALHVLCSLQIFAATIFQNSFVYKSPNLNAYNIYQIEAVAIVGSRYGFFVHRSHVRKLDVQICAKLKACKLFSACTLMQDWQNVAVTAQKMKLSIKDFFSKYDQILRKLWIWSHLLKKSLMENFIFVQCLFSYTVFEKAQMKALWKMIFTKRCSCFKNLQQFMRNYHGLSLFGTQPHMKYIKHTKTTFGKATVLSLSVFFANFRNSYFSKHLFLQNSPLYSSQSLPNWNNRNH